MPTFDPNKVVLPVFAGCDITSTSFELATEQAVRDADSPIGSLLLSSCLDAFHIELAALSPEEVEQSGIRASDFHDPHRFLKPDPTYTKNHIISTTRLFLVQVLRYQSFAHSDPFPLVRPLQTNLDRAAGVLGLSFGLFPACVVAASNNPISYITTSVEIFRLVFWVSLRVLQLTRKVLEENPADPTLPWGVVCTGLTKIDIEHQLARFGDKASALSVTAVLDEKRVIVSGRPDVLAAFSTFVSRHCTVHPMAVNVLYHSGLYLPNTRDQILTDIHKRQIRFPSYQDLRCPLRSTVSGDIIQSSPDGSLVEEVIDMVLVHPIHWDLVAKQVTSVIALDVELCLVNIGPGSSALPALKRSASDHALVCVDATWDARPKASSSPTVKQEPIAIIGMAAHTPGAVNATELWELLERGIDTVSKIPYDRFRADDGSLPCETNVETGNFMSDVAGFDHAFFNISPREARNMDPQQRVLLHTAYEALENAGYVPDATPCFQRARFGCYVGSITQDYLKNLSGNIDTHFVAGISRAFLCGRISHAFQWGGPSIMVDTACSASIVSIYQACRALAMRDCDAALAGGVNIMTDLAIFAGLERDHFLSLSGQGKAFDASADGYSRGDGCCLLVLKRLSDAITENDTILGVIRGIEVNQSGLASSIMFPHVPTMNSLFETLFEHAGISPARVSVVEAHSAGTQAGDPSELQSIRSVLTPGRTPDNPLHVTSIKANIGHLESASGAIGVCKVLLMLRHNIIPAQISLKTLHPRIGSLEKDNMIIDTLPTAWGPESAPRVAMVNNFGAAGSNGALLLEEYTNPEKEPVIASFVFGMSAKSADALERLRSRYVQWLVDVRTQSVPICDIAYTATARRHIYPFRLGIAANNRRQLLQVLRTAPVTHVAPRNSDSQVVFVFPGQGSQYANMGASLYATSSVFKACIDKCNEFLLSHGYPAILPIISSEIGDHVLEADDEFEAYQCAVLAIEFALASLWRHWGVEPAGVIGHSLGEYAALVTAGVMSIETALSIVAKRARLMSRTCVIGKTGMVSVTLSSTQTQDILSAHPSFPNITIACVNSDASCVVSGPVEELQIFATYLTSSHSCKTVMLDVKLGFHSAAMDAVLDDLKDYIATLDIHPPTIPIASNVYGTVIPAGDDLTFQAEYFAKHCRQPVLFAQGLRELEHHLGPSRIDAWVDMGPHSICLPMVQATLSLSQKTLCLPTMLKGTSAWDTMSNSLAQLYHKSIPIDWRRVFDERGAFSCVDLPSYHFDSQQFWIPIRHRTVGLSEGMSEEYSLPRRSRLRPSDKGGETFGRKRSEQTLVPGSRPSSKEQEQRTSDITRIRKIMADVLGIAESYLEDDAHLDALGLNSLGRIEAQYALQIALSRSIPHDTFVKFPTISALCNFLVGDPGNEDVPNVHITPGDEASIDSSNHPGVDSERIRGVLAEVLGIAKSSEVEDDADFGALGLNSLGRIEAHHALQIALNRPIPQNIFSNCTTLSALYQFLGKGSRDAEDKINRVKNIPAPAVARNVSDFALDVTPVPLQQFPGSINTPLYLVHDGSGLISHYEKLSPLDRDVWGIINPCLFGDVSWESIDEMAVTYANAIERHVTRADLMLAGWSFGGVVAFEMARILASRGLKIKGVILIDSPSPSVAPLVSDSAVQRSLPSVIDYILPKTDRSITASTRTLVHRQFQQNSSLYHRHKPRDVREYCSPLAFLRCTTPFSTDNMEEGVRTWFRDFAGPWEIFIGRPLAVWDLPVNHFEPFLSLNVKETSAQLDRACQYLETL